MIWLDQVFMYMYICFFRHFQKGLRLDPEHSELKKAYFGLKNLLKKSKSVSPIFFLDFFFSPFFHLSLGVGV
jgi:Na+/H+ antiporter NhaD/arsenite permease-like protein